MSAGIGKACFTLNVNLIDCIWYCCGYIEKQSSFYTYEKRNIMCCNVHCGMESMFSVLFHYFLCFLGFT